MNKLDREWILSRLDAFVEENREAIVRDMKAVIDIDSVRGEPDTGAPYGAGVRKALDTAKAIAAGMGLAVDECDGFMGWAEIPGDSEKQLATIAHLDVVPAGNGWDSDPFGMVEKDGWLIGRGTSDDKGPLILTLYMAKFFKEYCDATGRTLPYTLRVLMGCSEETGMTDVDYYLDREPMPAFLFTPDANFPVGYGEKGGFGGTFESARLSGNLVDFTGGVAGNVVPDRASALVRGSLDGLRDTAHVKVAAEGDGLIRVTGYGIGGHASTPAGTVNAIALVVDYLMENKLCTPEEEHYLAMLQTLLATTDGRSVGIACRDEMFDALTCIGGTITMEDGVLRQTIDVRYPTAISGEELTAACKLLAETGGAKFIPGRCSEPFYISPDSAEVAVLMDAYRTVTGLEKKPFTMGGGTYARHFRNAVSFGPDDPDAAKPDWVGSMHGANEGVELAFMLNALKIYIRAMAGLMELEF